MALALNKNVRVTKRISAKPVPKAKTPQDTLWPWLLAEQQQAIEDKSKRLAYYTTRPHSTLRGLQLIFNRRLPHRRVKCTTVFKTLQQGAWAAHIKQWRFEQHF